MPQFTIDQLNPIDVGYNTGAALGSGFLDSDLLMASIGTNTHDLSSVKISFRQLVEDYMITNYSEIHGFTITGNVSAQGGLSANGGSTSVGGGTRTIRLNDLPTAATGLQTGDLFTRTAAQLDGTGSTKVICVA